MSITMLREGGGLLQFWWDDNYICGLATYIKINIEYYDYFSTSR